MDAVDPSIVDKASVAIASVHGIQSVDDLRVRWIGHTLRAEAAVSVARGISLEAAHDIAHRAEEHLLQNLPRLTAATVHTSPAGVHPRVAVAEQ